MAVIAVGDFDRNAVEQLIRERFARIPAAKKPRPRPRYGVPPRPAAAAAIATDREATSTRVNVHFVRPARPRGTVSAYRTSLVARLYSQMLDTRLSELAQKPNPPFLGAGSGTGHLVRSADAFSVGLVVADTGVRLRMVNACRIAVRSRALSASISSYAASMLCRHSASN